MVARPSFCPEGSPAASSRSIRPLERGLEIPDAQCSALWFSGDMKGKSSDARWLRLTERRPGNSGWFWAFPELWLLGPIVLGMLLAEAVSRWLG